MPPSQDAARSGARYGAVGVRRVRDVAGIWLSAGSAAVAAARRDPPRAVVLVAQRLPPGPVRSLARTGSRLTRRRTAGRACCEWFSGDHVAAVRTLRDIGADPRSESGAVRAALLAQALGTHAGFRAASAAVRGERAAEIRAEYEWNAGNLRRANDLLHESGLTTARARVLANRYAGELQILQGRWRACSRRSRTIAGVRGRVLHVTTNSLPHTRSGYSLRTQQLAIAQRRIGLEPHVVTRLGYPLTVGRLATGRIDVIDGVPYHRLLAVFRRDPPDRQLLRQVELTDALVEVLRPAVLHPTSHYPNGLAALAVARRHDLPVVYEVRGFLEETWASRLGPDAAATDRYRLSRERETECMLAADRVVTLGEAMRAEIVARGVPAERVVVVPNAVEDAEPHPSTDRDGVRRRLGFRPDTVVVGTVSSVVDYEGLDTLLDAVALLAGGRESVAVLVVGAGTALASLRARAEALRLGPAARLIGAVPSAATADFHAALDIFVLPRHDHRVTRLVTPLKPLEAMRAGRPVIASDLPALRELVTPERGRLVPAGDAAALAAAVAELAADRALRCALGGEARRWVTSDRTWTANARRYRQLYRDLGAA